jgi:hypothetical protein
VHAASPVYVRTKWCEHIQATLYQPFRSVTPLSRIGSGPEALRPSITAGMPFANDGGCAVVYERILLKGLALLIDYSSEKL